MMSKSVFYDLWGYPVDWTNPLDGWDDQMRKSLIDMTDIVVTQSNVLKNYTEIGYMKMPIPSKLYKFILEQRQMQESEWEDCQPTPMKNCLEIKANVRLEKIFLSHYVIFLILMYSFLYLQKIGKKSFQT